jgi:hypothetical protein
VEFNLPACRVARKDSPSAVEYNDVMMDKFVGVPESQFRVSREIEKKKLQMARAYSKKVKEIVSDR